MFLEIQVPSALQNLTDLKLHFLPKLRCIWRPTMHTINFQSLTTMSLWSCEQLAYLFWPSLARTMVHLKELEIDNCSSLEHLIKEEENGDIETVSNMSWPNLKTIKIVQCKRMKYVFPITLVKGLPCLEDVTIENCDELTKLFNMTKEKEVDIALPYSVGTGSGISLKQLFVSI